jgi:hypothetical protein
MEAVGKNRKKTLTGRVGQGLEIENQPAVRPAAGITD